MLHLIKIIILLLILSTNAIILSAEEISEISEQTFIDKIKEHGSSEKNELKSSTPKVGLFTSIASVKKHPGSLVLSLKDAIIRTLSNNISIQVESFNNMVKKESVAESLSEFDATLGLELSTGRKTQQLASAFSSPNRMENDNDNWDLSLSQKLITGANYQFDFTNNRNKTNSKTAGLNPSYRSEFQLSLTQPLLKNFGVDLNKRNVHIANNKVDISENEFKTKVIAVVSEIEKTYWDFVFSLRDLEVKQISLERAKALQRLVKSQVLVGTLAPIETLQAESEVASREEFLLTAQDAIEDNQDKLKNILNIEFLSSEGLSPIYPSTPANIIIEDIDIKESMKMALANRPDYLGKKKDLENKDILVKYQENQIYPSVDLVGSMGLNGLSGEAITITSGTFQGTSAYGGSYGNALTDSLSTNYYDWELGVKFSYPLGNRAAKSKLSTSRLEKAQLILGIKELEKKIILDIRDSVRQLKTDSKRIKAATVAKQLAEEALKAEETKFKVGLSTSFNVLKFQEDLAEAQSNEIKTIIDYKQSRIRFRSSTASTLKYHDVTLSAKEST
ncbi:MAG TPA: TolC family protein [Nitrospinaceae bacterium]|jgi:outer membrane protein TolC|nr:TolC family protein [Nitrospinaceae bacterium]